MAQERESSQFEDLFQSTRSYIDTQLQLLKLKSVQKASQLFSVAATVLLLSVLGLMALILLSIGLSLYLGKVLGSYFLGFFLTGGIFIVTALIIFSFRKRLLQIALSNWLIRLLLNDDSKKED